MEIPPCASSVPVVVELVATAPWVADRARFVLSARMQEQLEIVVDSASFSLVRPTMPQTVYTELRVCGGDDAGQEAGAA